MTCECDPLLVLVLYGRTIVRSFVAVCVRQFKTNCVRLYSSSNRERSEKKQK